MRLAILAGRLLTVALLAIAPGQAQAAETLRFLTNLAPPYQEMVAGELDGTSMRALTCIMKRLDQRYEVGLAPWLRAREQVRQGAAQGLFAVAPDRDADGDGRLSMPLALERWVWVRPARTGPMPSSWQGGGSIAAIIGSNQLKWLESQGAAVDGAARSADQLLRMLLGGRVGTVLMGEAELHYARQAGDIDAAALSVSFHRYMPLGVYFAGGFLKANPGFLERFDAEVPHCAAANMALSPTERRVALAVAQGVKEQLSREYGLIPALLAASRANGAVPVQQIMAADQDFQAHRTEQAYPAALTLHDHPLTALLSRLRAASGGVVSEILLFDNVGMTLAADPMPSDLWQADEAKYSMTVPQGPDAVFIDNIDFDQSTNQFSVQVSLTIAGDQPGQVIGGLTVGLNIERTLNPR
ncbi:hypothetical protein [Niveispirillum sp. KHB5.9]|uniref:hypothetical protein n=1 Tax=Niveispirillum sp. KHB5.9 TaxID=3400269 RepID=UPI003A8B0CA5